MQSRATEGRFLRGRFCWTTSARLEQGEDLVARVSLWFGTLVPLVVLSVDVATLERLYRIASGFAAGVRILGGAYLYHRLEKVLDPRQGRSPLTPSGNRR